MNIDELKLYLDGKFGEVDANFAELDANFAEVNARFAEVNAKFADVHAEFAQVRAEIEASETRLLSEFWKWSRVADQRTRRVEQSDASTIERLAVMEERIFTLERKAAGSKE